MADDYHLKHFPYHWVVRDHSVVILERSYGDVHSAYGMELEVADICFNGMMVGASQTSVLLMQSMDKHDVMEMPEAVEPAKGGLEAIMCPSLMHRCFLTLIKRGLALTQGKFFALKTFKTFFIQFLVQIMAMCARAQSWVACLASM